MSILCIAVAGQPPPAQVFPLSLSPQFPLFGGWGSCHHSCVFDTNCSVGQGSEAGESPEEKKNCQSRLSVNMIYHYHSIEEEEYAASSLPSYYYGIIMATCLVPATCMMKQIYCSSSYAYLSLRDLSRLVNQYWTISGCDVYVLCSNEVRPQRLAYKTGPRCFVLGRDGVQRLGYQLQPWPFPFLRTESCLSVPDILPDVVDSSSWMH
ncbi:hypothetical protein F4815DRAFT_488867 [Daldinia loculata]|nr:hypothetical protein F4815DRAFT_488867 [Daldinia loculata]